MSMNLGQLGKGMALYSSKYNRVPDSMEAVVKEGFIEGAVLFYPGEHKNRKLNKEGFPTDGGDVIFLPVQMGPRLVTAYVDPKFVSTNQACVLMSDSSTRVVPLKEAIEMIQGSHKWLTKNGKTIPARSVTALKALQKMATAAARKK